MPSDPFAQAQALHQKGRVEEAARLYKKVLRTQPRHFGALNLYAIAASQLGQIEEAERALHRAIGIDDRSEVLHYNRGTILRQLGRFEDALASFDRALALNADAPDSWNNRGVVLKDLGRAAEALESFARALALRPDHAETLFNQANTLVQLRRPVEAVAVYRNSLAVRADPAVLANLGNALRDLGRAADALAAYDRALALDPSYADALQARCLLLMTEARYPEVIATAGRALAADPNAAYMLGHLIHAKAHVCDWSRMGELEARLHRGLAEGRKVCPPFALLAVDSTPAEQLAAARTWSTDRYPLARGAYRHGTPHDRGRLRVAYMSGEYRAHATSFLIAGLFETHDRARFEVIGVSSGASDDSDMRRRIEGAFDGFLDVSTLSDDEAARILREKEIDILVDLNGYFGTVRAGIPARRPAPVQVNYLGFPGTSGTPYMDYILADRWVIPDNQQRFYSEKVVYLPDCYQANDARRAIAPQAPGRADAGLAESAFVFCCFNNTHKITPGWFGVWMEILRGIEGSVLWLLEANETVAQNLRREAGQRGVAAERIVFAPRKPLSEHLARHRLADLFLDTLPHNAHTTASDALWAGLPVLTCAGAAFAGRVAASLLDAVGLGDMIATSRDDYIAAAVRLAKALEALRDVRERLAAQRLTHPLFDTARFTRHIESAYDTMWQRYKKGRQPAGFAVERLP